MSGEVIEGTVVVDVGCYPSHNGIHADFRPDPTIGIRIGWGGEIEYAARGEKPNRVWWWAGRGEHRESS